VLTTGSLQLFTDLFRRPVGGRAVVTPARTWWRYTARGRVSVVELADRPPGRFLGPGTIQVVQDGRVLHAAYHRRLIPNRSISTASASLASADLRSGPIVLAWHAGH
jgi:hypothetical protein